jgi:hypothetical protein
MVRRILIGAVGALAFGVMLAVGCTRADVEVVKILPEPPLHTLPAKPKPPAKIKQAPKVVRKHVRRTWQDGEPGWVPPGGISKRWACIVIHHSATGTGCAGEFHHAHLQRGWDELGYHFVIGNGTGSGNGQIEVGSRWYKQKHGAHCRTAGNYHNEHGIGICLVGNFEKGYPSAEQLASLNKLVRFLMTRCNIHPGRVIGHREAPGTRTKCPGRHLSIAQVRARARSYVAASGF